MAKMQKHVKRSQDLVLWLQDLQSRWLGNEAATRFVTSNPEIIAVWQIAMLKELDDSIRSQIAQGKLECQSPAVKSYTEIRDHFVNGVDGTPVRLRMKDRRKADYMYQNAVDSFSGRLNKYALENYCGLSVAGGDAFFNPKTEKEKSDREWYMKGIERELLRLRIEKMPYPSEQ
jgi:hypothetical protein